MQVTVRKTGADACSLFKAGEQAVPSFDMATLNVGDTVRHGKRGTGIIKAIDKHEHRGKPFHIEFENGETHRYSAASSAKLMKVDVSDGDIKGELEIQMQLLPGGTDRTHSATTHDRTIGSRDASPINSSRNASPVSPSSPVRLGATAPPRQSRLRALLGTSSDTPQSPVSPKRWSATSLGSADAAKHNTDSGIAQHNLDTNSSTQLLRVDSAHTCTLVLTVNRGTGLSAKDRGGTSDPYVTMKVGSRTVKKTSVKKKTVNPVWDESFSFHLKSMDDNVVLQVNTHVYLRLVIHMYTHTWVYKGQYTWAYTWLHTWVYICLHKCQYTWMCICIWVCTCRYACLNTCLYTCLCTGL